MRRHPTRSIRSLASLAGAMFAAMLLSTTAQSAGNWSKPAEAAPYEGIWLIDLKASGLPGYGKTPPQLTKMGEDARAKNQRQRAAGDVSFDLTARCSNPGVPRIMSLPNPIQILPRADQVLILFEWNHLLRQINVDGKEHEVLYNMAAGLSTGSWKSGKLVARTVGRNDKTLLDDSIPNSEDLQVTEEFSVRRGGRILDYTVTIEDPAILLQPFTRHYVLRKLRPEQFSDTDVCLDRVQAGKPAVPKGF